MLEVDKRIVGSGSGGRNSNTTQQIEESWIVIQVLEMRCYCEVGEPDRTTVPGHFQARKSFVYITQQRMEYRAVIGRREVWRL